MSNWRPPDEFMEVESHLDGVRVYAAKPVEENVDAAEKKTFRCPSCGSPTSFKVATGAVTCDYCDWTGDQGQDKRVGRKALATEFTLEALQAAQHGWGVQRRELNCENCGGNLALDEGSLSSTCPFCASNRVRIREKEDTGLRPTFLIPFAVDRPGLKPYVKEWLSRGWIHPRDLNKADDVEKFAGIYMPFWTFSARLEADWEGEVGHTETYQEWDSDSGRFETQTRTVWKWEKGHVDIHLENWDIAGSTQLSRLLLEKLRPWDFDAFVEFSPDYLPGWQAQTYDCGLLEAWDLGKAAMREACKGACHQQAGGSKMRNFSMVCDLDDEAWRYVLLPVWVSVYKFGGKTWRVLVNGQTGNVVGQKPVAWWKIWLAICLMLTPAIAMAVISLPLMLLGGFGFITLFIALVFLILGGVGSSQLYAHAVASEAL